MQLINVWLNAMICESEPQQPFCSEEFMEWTDFVLGHFNMEQDIVRHSVRESETSHEETDGDWIELFIQESYIKQLSRCT